VERESILTESKNKSGATGSSKTGKTPTSKTAASKSRQSTDQSNDENLEITKTNTSEPVIAASQAMPTATGSASGIGLLALLLSLLALGAAGYSWYQTAVNARIAGGAQVNRLSAVEQQFGTVKETQSEVTEQIRQVRQRVADTETGVAEQVSQVKQLVSATESALGAQISEVKQQIIKSEGDVGTRIREIRAQTETQQQQVAAQVSSAQQGLEQQTTTFRGEFDTLAASIGELRSELGTSIDSWSLREIEHLLVMANQRLQLGGDAVMARKALQIAESRLRSIGNPALLPTREALSQEIAALSQVKEIDFAGVTNTISLLSNTLENLPISGTGDTTGPDMSAKGDAADTEGNSQEGGSATDKITSIGKSFLSDLGSLVQVEKGGKPVAPSISAEIAQMTLTRGHLILEGAQVALLRQQPDVYLDRLNAAEAWVGEKFDTGNDQTADWLSQLGGLKEVVPKVEVPDISGSLNALRSVIGKED